MSPAALHEPARHEPFSGPAWSEAGAREAIGRIVAETVADRRPDGHWPVHPLDAEGETPRRGFKSLYLGSAGVLWALAHLAGEGAVRPAPDTAEGIWQRLFMDNVEQVWRTWLFDEKAGCHLWTQDLYGRIVQYFGAGHGFAGNAYPLLKSAALLDAGRREALYQRCLQALRVMAVHDEGAVNWPSGTFTPRAGGTRMLLQWCHGAPGIISALADLPAGWSAEFDALLVAGGEAIWRAGPLTKGHGLCHGTAGNGYALLKLFQRTGERRWLERARAFAMHAVGQCERMRARHGHGRHTLWNGDLGLALFLWHCRDGQATMPLLDLV